MKNPYDFVPLGRPSRRSRPPGHQKFPEPQELAPSSGIIRARLTTRGPFLIARQIANPQGAITPLADGKLIPGSSLKGMLRSIAEIVGGGCISISSSLYFRGSYEYRMAPEPAEFRPCGDINELCVTCRSFGALLKPNAWKGLIEPGEATWKRGNGKQRVLDIIVGQPKPQHHAFYVKDGTLRGRKAYYHHPTKIMLAPPAQHATYGARQTIHVRALEPGQVYEFVVRHHGLDRESYELLLYALFLETGLVHKLGWGKPMGLGSVEIEPLSIEEIDLRARYKRGGDQATRTRQGADALAYVHERTRALRTASDDVMKAFRRIFAFPGPDAKWSYPSYAWFRERPTATLEAFNDDGEEQ